MWRMGLAIKKECLLRASYLLYIHSVYYNCKVKQLTLLSCFTVCDFPQVTARPTFGFETAQPHVEVVWLCCFSIKKRRPAWTPF